MQRVYLGFKAFDIHELLCHFIAKDAGLYNEAQLELKLIDSTFINTESLPAPYFSAACGAALIESLNTFDSEFSPRIVFTAAARPMFWFVSLNKSLSEMKDLCRHKSLQLAGYPVPAPPHHLFSGYLQQQSFGDYRLSAVATDVARLGLLKSAEADAALLSSAMLDNILTDPDIKILSCLANESVIPTSGLAITRGLSEKQPELVAIMMAIYGDSLALIHRDDDLLSKVLVDDFGFNKPNLGRVISIIRSCYSFDGRCPAPIGDKAIKDLSLQLAVDGTKLLSNQKTCLYLNH